ncbi:MFS transporter [Pikeienuella piscinae]|uniref:MFS transporter n=1 Tax=Pikeienuella piscinae TaxID=2748098 RepID=A0A7M3T660_9RHOB|nr:MFS transporter [Pikeienuella piscinae]QIE57491.1 MFS transporter [Pikeienuella piscinae]
MPSPTDDPKRGALLIPVLSAANFTIGVGAFMVIGVLGPIAGDLSMTEAEAGLIITVYAVAYMIGSPLLVASTGGFGRRNLLAGALVVFAAAAVLMALAESAAALLAGRALAAIAAGVVSPVVAATAAASATPETRGRVLAAAFFGLTLSQVVGVPMGVWVGYTYGWRVDFWAIAALSLLAAVAIRRFVPKDIAADPGRLADLGAALADWRAMLAISFTTIFVGAAYLFYTFVAPVLEAGMGMGRDGVSLFLLVCGFGAVAGNLMAGRLADRIGPARTLGLLCLVVIAVLPVFSMLPTPAWALYLAAFVWSAFGWGFFAVQQMRLFARAPQQGGVILSLNAAALYLGMSLGSALGAALVAWVGLHALGWGASALAALALLNLVVAERALALRGAAA